MIKKVVLAVVGFALPLAAHADGRWRDYDPTPTPTPVPSAPFVKFSNGIGAKGNVTFFPAQDIAVVQFLYRVSQKNGGRHFSMTYNTGGEVGPVPVEFYSDLPVDGEQCKKVWFTASTLMTGLIPNQNYEAMPPLVRSADGFSFYIPCNK